MGKLVAAIVGNPTLLLWLTLGAFALGLASGGSGAWWVQGLRLDAVQAKFDGFVATVKAQGEAAQKIADAKVAEYKRKKESSDHEYQITIAALNSDVKRLRDARARSGYLPAPGPGASRPELACFNRVELERTLQHFDDGLSGLIAEGDAATVGLNVARRWNLSRQLPQP